MKMMKRTFKFFSVADWEDEEAYLRAMHQKGWKLRNGGLVYTFDRCEPEDVVYQLDYNEQGHKNHDEYVQMFADCGWEYIQDFAGYSYFRKPVSEMRPGEDGIFCDDMSRYEMVKRVWSGRMVPVMAMFLLVIMLISFTLLNGALLGSVMLTTLYWGLFALYVWIFAKMGLKFWRLRERFRW